MAFENSIPAPDILSAEQYSLNTARQSIPNVDQAVKSADNKVKLQSDVMAVQDQQQDQSDQAKIATAMKGLNPNDPNYADNLIKAASDSGISSRSLLTLRQNLYVQEGDKLKNDFSKNQIQEQVAKMSDDQAARLGNMVELFNKNQSSLIDEYTRLTQQNGGKPPTSDQIAGLNTQRVAQIDAGIQELQDKEFHGLIDKKTGDAQIQQLQAAKQKPFDIQAIQDSYKHTQAYTDALTNRLKQSETQSVTAKNYADAEKAKADAAAAGKQVVQGEQMTTNADGSVTKTPTYSVVDKSTGNATNTGVLVPPKGAAASGGGRDAVMTSRVINAGEEIQGDLHNLMKLDIGSNQGWLSGKSDGGGVMSSVKSGLANKLSTQQTQTYNVEISGIQRNLAAIEASGLAPAGSLTHSMDSVVVQPGDTSETAMRKMAQIRQITVNGMKNILNKDDVNDAQKKEVQGIMDGIKQAVPFTQDDIDGWKSSKKKGETFNDYMNSQKQSGQSGDMGGGWSVTVH